MFQKLYRHLEEISKSLREGRTSTTSAQSEIIDQLETMNLTLVRLNQQLAADRNADARQVETRQIEMRAFEPAVSVEPSVVRRRSGGRTGIVSLITVAALIPLLIFIAFNLVQINRTLVGQTPPRIGLAQSPAILPGTTAPMTAAPLITAPEAARLDAAGRLAVQQHLAKLDSLITEQNQTITELKRLNSTAVATMQRIRRHFILSEHIVQASWTQPVDSLAVAR
jgi:hypothetical protein